MIFNNKNNFSHKLDDYTKKVQANKENSKSGCLVVLLVGYSHHLYFVAVALETEY